MKKIICKIFLDHILFITKTDNKIVESVLRILLHNMPQNWLITNLDHRLWAVYALFADSGTESSCQYYNLHAITVPFFLFGYPDSVKIAI